jgi:hypothetical protein
MKKGDRIGGFLEQHDGGSARPGPLHPCYTGFFKCFNEERYFEAHDVLEHLWLRCHDGNRHFFKGLIQVAGAFVHLQKQFLRPDHPKDAKRLRPAVRLFRLGVKNIGPFQPKHMQLDVESLRALCDRLAEKIIASDFRKNPWRPGHGPQLKLNAADPAGR